MISAAAQNWLFTSAGLFLAEGTSWVVWMGQILLGLIGIRFLVEIASGGTGEAAIPWACYRLGRWFIVFLLITGYNVPAAMFGGLSFHQLIPEEARQLLIQTQNNTLTKALDTVDGLQVQAEKETDWWSPGEQAAATVFNWMVSAFNGVMLLLSCGGYVLMAIAVTVGPLSIPWLTFDGTAFLFWDWLSVLIGSAMYQVVGAVLVNIWANVMIQAGPFFLGVDIVQMALLFAGLMIAIFLSAIGIGWIVSALYGRAGGAAANLAQTAANATVSVVQNVTRVAAAL
jgi:hypothetical protein